MEAPVLKLPTIYTIPDGDIPSSSTSKGESACGAGLAPGAIDAGMSVTVELHNVQGPFNLTALLCEWTREAGHGSLMSHLSADDAKGQRIFSGSFPLPVVPGVKEAVREAHDSFLRDQPSHLPKMMLKWGCEVDDIPQFPEGSDLSGDVEIHKENIRDDVDRTTRCCAGCAYKESPYFEVLFSAAAAQRLKSVVSKSLWTIGVMCFTPDCEFEEHVVHQAKREDNIRALFCQRQVNHPVTA